MITLVPLAFVLGLDTDSPKAGNHTWTVKMGEMKRTYHVHVPEKYDAKKPTPVVLALHGAAMTGRMMRWFTDLDRKADREGFIVVYPDGTGSGSFLTWNAGSVFRLAGNRADDVAFLRAMLDDLGKKFNVDSKRVFATGMSNG